MSRRTRVFVLVGLLVTVLMAGFGSYYASSSPDGLARVASDKGLGRTEQVPASDGSPLAGYSVRGVGDQRLSGGLAGVAGVALTFLLVGAIAVGVRRRGSDAQPDEDHADQSPGGGGKRS